MLAWQKNSELVEGKDKLAYWTKLYQYEHSLVIRIGGFAFCHHVNLVLAEIYQLMIRSKQNALFTGTYRKSFRSNVYSYKPALEVWSFVLWGRYNLPEVSKRWKRSNHGIFNVVQTVLIFSKLFPHLGRYKQTLHSMVLPVHADIIQAIV